MQGQRLEDKLPAHRSHLQRVCRPFPLLGISGKVKNKAIQSATREALAQER